MFSSWNQMKWIKSLKFVFENAFKFEEIHFKLKADVYQTYKKALDNVLRTSLCENFSKNTSFWLKPPSLKTSKMLQLK